jgi:RNA polymerase sigma-70 factor (ECF subfamily)
VTRPPKSTAPTTAAAWRRLPPRAAVEQLLELHGDRLHSIATRLCRNRDDADDLVQETFLQAFRKWAQFAGEADPMSWLYSIAARACQRMHRRRAGEPAHQLSLEADAPFADELVAVPDAGDPAARAEQRARLEAAILALPLTYRMPLVLKDIVGLEVEAIAAVLGVAPTTVRTRAHRARMRLRTALAKVLPKRALAPAAYSRQVCLDLLRVKQLSLDLGVPMPGGDELVCARCRAVFATMDLAHDVCAHLAKGKLPATLRQRILAQTE